MLKSLKLVRFILFIIVILYVHDLFAQNKPITYSNSLNAYYNKSASNGPVTFFELKIYEITLNSDSMFEFLSQPNINCFICQQFKGI
jgi:hypothetical protein